MDARLIAFLSMLVCAPAAGFDHSHAAWTGLLGKHVVLLQEGKASRVSYAGMGQDRSALRDYLSSLSAVNEHDFAAWSRPEQVAFLINAYNAYAVEKILTRYPKIGSIWDFGRFFGNPFRDAFFTLLGARMSLDDIEHGLLRRRYGDPRVHYAVNCASVSCPMLREEAYTGAQLESQLEEQARRFLSDRSRNRVRGNRLEVSKIFEWFRDDFEPLERYFARYAAVLADNPAEQEKIAARSLTITFLDYDWSLNDSRSSSPR